MWIIPNNLSSAHAPVCEDWREESSIGARLERSFMWRSKPLPLKIWSDKWSKVWWLQHLFGRILKPSMEDLFVEKYTESLADIRVNHFPLPVSARVVRIQDTYGRTTVGSSTQLDLFGASSRTFTGTSALDTTLSGETYTALVTRLRKEYSQRRRLARRTYANGYLSLLWTTAVSTDFGRSTGYKQGGTALSLQVKENWPTALSRDYKDTPGMSTERDGRELGRVDQLARAVYYDGRQDGGKSSTSGSRRVLNPAWVMCLLGTTLEKTFFAWREMPLSSSKQRLRG